VAAVEVAANTGIAGAAAASMEIDNAQVSTFLFKFII
jgi:hypothetical protein